MNNVEQAITELQLYLYDQFPATIGHIPLIEKFDTLTTLTKPLEEENKRLKEHIANTAGLLRNAANNVRENDVLTVKEENKRLREALSEAVLEIDRTNDTGALIARCKALTKPT